MTRIYDMKTKEVINDVPLLIAGFSIVKGDILKIDEKKYKVIEIEYVFIHAETKVVINERKIYVEECL